MLYLGIDQHARQITISLRDENGDVVQARQVSTQPKMIHAFFQQLMRERLRAVQGRVKVHSRPGAGTTIEVFIPFLESMPGGTPESRAS